jgi:WD40-like Beta Propeller Repeat
MQPLFAPEQPNRRWWRPKSMMTRLVGTLAALAVIAGIAACAHGEPAATASADVTVSVAAPGASGTGVGTGVANASGTAIGATAFGGHGRLAFVSSGRLFVLDGTAPGRPAALHPVSTANTPTGKTPTANRPTGKTPTANTPTANTPGSPAWSPDGRWLAFLVGPSSADGAVTSGALWLAGPDGQGAHQVLANVAGFAWSPKADEAAATSGDGGKLFAVRPGKPTYPMLEVPGQFDGAPAWSPNGREVAVASVGLTAAKRFASSVIDLFVPSEGIVVNSLASSRANALIVDGWWADGEGVLAWSDPRDAATAPTGGLPLVSYPLGDGPTATLASTPADPAFAVPDGAGVTLVTGGNRYPWSAETITYCGVAGHCGPAPGALPAPVNLDPASSQWRGEPDLAFAHCATEPTKTTGTTGTAKTTAGVSPQDLSAWYQTCRLWYAGGVGGNAVPITRAGAGVAAPTWSATDGDLLYVRDNSLWLIPMRQPSGALSTAPALRVAGRLFAGSGPNADGRTAWQTQFAWHSQPSAAP